MVFEEEKFHTILDYFFGSGWKHTKNKSQTTIYGPGQRVQGVGAGFSPGFQTSSCFIFVIGYLIFHIYILYSMFDIGYLVLHRAYSLYRGICWVCLHGEMTLWNEQGSSEANGRSDDSDQLEIKVVSSCCYPNCCLATYGHVQRRGCSATHFWSPIVMKCITKNRHTGDKESLDRCG